ncbi:hypothetical protein DH2020_002281 [Rehmannia glutinosa]|uniref:DUF4378 domain-containing protein n=1 Tax=Rehmannia glutinosa TaxID=99300 RepID=A0ABR0XTU8_REHGL
MALLDSSERPMMLKDFLRDEGTSSSSSNYRFQMYPRKKPCKSTVLISSKSNKQQPAVVLLRSWSKKAAVATKVSAIHKVINAVKFLQFVKSPLVLPRSNSRKLTKRKKDKNDILMSEGKVKVKVKDILRWRSFRDVVEDNSTPLYFPSSPNRTTTTTSCSKRSSWCDSDFTAEELPLSGGENEEFWGKKFIGQNATLLLRNPKGNWTFEECEQQSPVSVLDTPFREFEEFIPTLANVERTRSMLTRRIQELEVITKPKHTRKLSFGGEIAINSEGAVNAEEEKAKQLLSHVKEEVQSSQANDHLILDFFTHELSINGKFNDVEFDNEILRIARSWMNGDYDYESYEWEVEDNRKAYVMDMEKGVSNWHQFRQEQEEMSKELEVMVLDDLIHDVLDDFLTK